MMIPRNPKSLTVRRLVLLASVAGVGAAVLLSGAGSYGTASLPVWTSTAAAADSAMQHPAGFADLVEVHPQGLDLLWQQYRR